MRPPMCSVGTGLDSQSWPRLPFATFSARRRGPLGLIWTSESNRSAVFSVLCLPNHADNSPLIAGLDFAQQRTPS